MDVAVFIKSVGLITGVDVKLLQDVKIKAKNKVIIELPMFFNFPAFLRFAPNYDLYIVKTG
jgi:hypothetical protein